MSEEKTKPQPRPLKLEAHVLAYLGDFMSVFEESVKRLAIKEVRSNIQKPRDKSPASQ
jgi:hypothetical protein